MKTKIPSIKIILSIVIIFFFTFPYTAALAADFSVEPLIIDVEAKARDTFTKTVTLVNHQDRSLRLFASVHEISVGEESEIKSFIPASMGDRAVSVTSWIEISRARIDLAPGGEKEIPLVIRVNPATPPGLYHAFVGFAPAPNRDEAEAKVLSGQASGVVIRVLVGTKQQEFLRLVSFSTDRFSFSDTEGKLTYVLENTGDVPLSPTGDVIIYDARGNELTSIALNEDGQNVINPGEKATYTENIPFINRLGKNKAYLSLEYGVKNRAAVYDTNFYYSIPWLYLVVIMLLLLLVLVTIVLLFRRGGKNDLEFDDHEARDIPLFVGKVREHSEYEHDINLKTKDE